MNEPPLCMFDEKPPLLAFNEKLFWRKAALMKSRFDEKLYWWKAVSMKSRFDEKLPHQQVTLMWRSAVLISLPFQLGFPRAALSLVKIPSTRLGFYLIELSTWLDSQSTHLGDDVW